LENRELFDEEKLHLTLSRLCAQLSETYGDFENTVLLGLQPRGVRFAKRIHSLLLHMYPGIEIPYGELDVTFFRDDFRRKESPLVANQTNIQFLLEKKRVILIDDVLYTGRTIRSAMDAMLSFGRPSDVKLLVLVDRNRKRELPVQADFCGLTVDTLDNEKVLVEWAEQGGKDSVRIQIRENKKAES
jgi:pyrimidine operon attenuation protein/uracil phosphoribosyltransferase